MCAKSVSVSMFIGQKRTYEEFKKQIPTPVFSAFDSLRQYCMSLGKNVVEDVRAHRIVFGKSLSFRWFADLEPGQDTIIIKIQKNRKEPLATLLVKPDDRLDEVKSAILEAYNAIR
jgi:predicted transport protein